MGRAPCCEGVGLKKGPWMPEEDEKLVNYIQKNGHRSWRSLPKLAGLNRCGKSCRLRWNNYLRPDIKRGKFTDEEQNLIISLHSILGNKWSQIASHLNGRTDNEIKNYWNTHLKKRLLGMGIDPVTHRPRIDLQLLASLPRLLLAAGSLNNSTTQWGNNDIRLQGNHIHTAQQLNMKLIGDLLQVVSTSSNPFIGASNSTIPSRLLSNLAFQDQNSRTIESETLNVGFMQPNAAYMTQSDSVNTFQGSRHDDEPIIDTSNIIPHSVSVSPSSSSVHEIEVNANLVDRAINSYSLTNTKALEELLMGDEAHDFSWADLLNQTSPPFPAI